MVLRSAIKTSNAGIYWHSAAIIMAAVTGSGAVHNTQLHEHHQ